MQRPLLSVLAVCWKVLKTTILARQKPETEMGHGQKKMGAQSSQISLSTDFLKIKSMWDMCILYIIIARAET